ncbi:hypothetical protein C8D97_102363 [Pleionea mediterranea]|uniref:Uncharacterized protein n=2 Tax=Pleionea mediterranea TaxID=523701 RepID=A0A316FZA2_9GAMM|nr:hypothetical protein C8D97_102363 [Pleionea mediterranea]
METDVKNLSIVFPDEGLTTGCDVSDLGNGLYRLVEHPIMAESAMYGDTILAELESQEQIRFKKVAEKSSYKMLDYVLPKELIESQEFLELKNNLTKRNIFWQQDFGGCFMCFLTQDEESEIRNEIERKIT